MKPVFGDVLRLKNGEQEATVMVVGGSPYGDYTQLLTLAVNAAAVNTGWEVGRVEDFLDEQLDDVFEPAPPMDTELAAAFNLVRA